MPRTKEVIRVESGAQTDLPADVSHAQQRCDASVVAVLKHCRYVLFVVHGQIWVRAR